MYCLFCNPLLQTPRRSPLLPYSLGQHLPSPSQAASPEPTGAAPLWLLLTLPCAPAHPASRHLPLLLPVLPQCRSRPPPWASPQLQAHAIFGLLHRALSSTQALVSVSQSVQLQHIIYLLSSLLRTYPNIVTVLLRLRRDFSSTWMQPILLQWPCAQSVNSSGRPNCPPGLSIGHHCSVLSKSRCNFQQSISSTELNSDDNLRKLSLLKRLKSIQKWNCAFYGLSLQASHLREEAELLD